MQILISICLWIKHRGKYICLKPCSFGDSLGKKFKYSSLEHICTSSLTTTLRILQCKLRKKEKKKLNHPAFSPYHFHLNLVQGNSQMHCRVTHLLNSFSHVCVYLFCFALPQAILSSLISENNSLIPLDQSRDTPWKGWCTGCLPDLFLWSGAGSICSGCASSFQVQEGSLLPKDLMPISTSCKRSEGADPLTALARLKQTLLATTAKLVGSLQWAAAHY